MDPTTVGAVMGGAQTAAGIWQAQQNKKAQEATNAANIQIAREQMAFQERMSSSAHQREAKDLEAAGLNRILSATGGSGASAPSGASATMVAPETKLGDVLKDTASSARDVMNQNAQIKNLDAATLKTVADTFNSVESGKGIQIDNSAKKVGLSLAEKTLPYSVKKASADSTVAQSSAASAPAEAALRTKTAEINKSAAWYDAIVGRGLDLLGGISSGVGKLFRPDSGPKTGPFKPNAPGSTLRKGHPLK